MKQRFKRMKPHVRHLSRCFLVVAIGGLDFGSQPAVALDANLPGPDFNASRYKALWSQSPFAVASAETAPQADAQYELVGFARIADVSYASLIDKGSQEHFLLSTQRPDRGLKLISIQIVREASSVRAILQKGDQELCLEMAAHADAATTGDAATSGDALQAQANPTTPAVNAPNLTNILAFMPHGGSLPIVFKPINPNLEHLTADQVAAVDQLRQDFAKAVSSANSSTTSSTTSPVVTVSASQGADPSQSPQLQSWQTAAEQSNERLEALLGYEGYSQYLNSLASK